VRGATGKRQKRSAAGTGGGSFAGVKQFGGSVVDALLKVGLPIAATAIGGPLGGIVSSVLLETLGGHDSDDSMADAILAAQGDQATMDALRQVEVDLRRIEMEEALGLEEQDKEKLAIVNATMQAEIAASVNNPTAAGWRPLWGYIGAWSWLGSLVFTFIFTPWAVFKFTEHLPLIVGGAFGFLSFLFTGMFTVLGIYARGRSNEKTGIAEMVGQLATIASQRPTATAPPMVRAEPIVQTPGIFRDGRDSE